MEGENYNTDIITPVDVKQLQKPLIESGYDSNKTQLLVNYFKEGFPIGYEGNKKRKSFSNNLPLSVGTPTQLWNKVMKEVKAGRVNGPYDEPPFENFIQSPLGLVPKHKPGETRLIFHLSHPHGDSVNSNTDQIYTKVQYNSLI